MRLSYSTMSLLHDCPHNYVNKANGIQQPESIYLTEGKAAHEILQKHVSGKEKHPLLSHIDLYFPIVEEKDFDPKTRFEVPYKNHSIFGFVDGLDKPLKSNPTVLLEGKFSSSPWSLSKYKAHPQRKIYGWAIRSLEYAILITGQRVPEKWEHERPKSARVPFTKQDYIDAENYIDYALRVIEEGDFLTDLVDGRCVDPRCYWGANCMFK